MSQKAAVVGSEGLQPKAAGAKTKSSSRQPPKTSPVISEAELRRQQSVSPEDVLRLERATEGSSLASGSVSLGGRG